MIQKNNQIYSIPTYDAAFKWILSEEGIRPSFFHIAEMKAEGRAEERAKAE